MAGMFDDLIPQARNAGAPNAAPPAGMFDDLIPAPQPQSSGSDTVATDPYAAQFPNPDYARSQPVAHSGYAAQVARTLSGNGPDLMAPPQTSPLDFAKGAAISALSGVPGQFGDMEATGRLALSPFGVSRQNSIPTTETMGNDIFGAPANSTEAAGRSLGGLASPLLLAKGLSLAGHVIRPVATSALGLSTGAGTTAIDAAYQAGKTGGTAAQTFLGNMRGNVPVSDVVDSAKAAVQQLKADRSAAYQAGIGSTIKGDPAILDFQPIQNAIGAVRGVGTYGGKSLSSSADQVWKAIDDAVSDWQASDPSTFHTAEGLDALKQKIGNITFDQGLKPGSPGAVVANEVYNAVKSQIVKQAPGYAKVMQDYSDASDELREIQNTLSLNPKANVDTSLRKLQSIMRNNANANYGARAASGQTLADNGATDLIPALAGQSLNSSTPRGLAGLGGMGGALAAIYTGHPGALAALPFSSPRIVGESAYALGRLGGYANQGAVAGGAGNAGILSIPAIANNPVLKGLVLQRLLTLPVAQQAQGASP